MTAQATEPESGCESQPCRFQAHCRSDVTLGPRLPHPQHGVTTVPAPGVAGNKLLQYRAWRTVGAVEGSATVRARGHLCSRVLRAAKLRSRDTHQGNGGSCGQRLSQQGCTGRAPAQDSPGSALGSSSTMAQH